MVRIVLTSLVTWGIVLHAGTIRAQEPTEPNNNQSDSLAGPLQQPGPVPEPAPIPEKEQVRIDVEVFPFLKSVEDDARMAKEKDNPGEYKAYNHILAFAASLDPELMARQAKEVPYADLIRPIRQDYQFELIHFEGRLRRLRVMKAPDYLREVDKIETLYEGWLFPDKVFNPVAIVFSELPEGIEPGEEVDYYVSFDGYFFKLLRYETEEHIGEGKFRWRRAPLLLGRTIRPIPRPKEENPWLSGDVGAALFGGFLFLVVVVVGVLLWYRRTDRSARARYTETRFEQSDPFGSGNIGSDPPHPPPH